MKQWVFNINPNSKAKNMTEEENLIINKWMKPKDNFKSSISESSESDHSSINSQKSQRSANIISNDAEKLEINPAQEIVYKSQDES